MIEIGLQICFSLKHESVHIAFVGIIPPLACVYFSMNSWVMGLSSSIPLLLNTEENYLIDAGVLTEVISTSFTLGSTLNIAMILLMVIGAPLLMILLV